MACVVAARMFAEPKVGGANCQCLGKLLFEPGIQALEKTPRPASVVAPSPIIANPRNHPAVPASPKATPRSGKPGAAEAPSKAWEPQRWRRSHECARTVPTAARTALALGHLSTPTQRLSLWERRTTHATTPLNPRLAWYQPLLHMRKPRQLRRRQRCHLPCPRHLGKTLNWLSSPGEEPGGQVQGNLARWPAASNPATPSDHPSGLSFLPGSPRPVAENVGPTPRQPRAVHQTSAGCLALSRPTAGRNSRSWAPTRSWRGHGGPFELPPFCERFPTPQLRTPSQPSFPTRPRGLCRGNQGKTSLCFRVKSLPRPFTAGLTVGSVTKSWIMNNKRRIQ